MLLIAIIDRVSSSSRHHGSCPQRPSLL